MHQSASITNLTKEKAMKTVANIVGVFDTDSGKLVGIAPSGVPDVTFLAGQDTQTNGLPVTATVNPLTGRSVFSGQIVAGAVPGIVSRRSRTSLIGDSWAVRDMPHVGPNWYGQRSMISVFNWTNRLMGGRFDLVYSNGTSGTPPWTWLSDGSLDSALAVQPDYLWISHGGNYVTTNPVSDFIDAFSAIFEKANAAGAMVITHTTPPNSAFNTAAIRLNAQEINNWLISVAPKKYGVIVTNITGATLAAGSLTFQPSAVITDGGVHNKMAGAFNVAQVMAKKLTPYVPTYEHPWFDIYDGTSGGKTNVIFSPTMMGNQGGLSVLTSTTGVPNGWTGVINAGESGTCNTSARTDGAPGNWLDFDVTFTAAGKVARATCNPGSVMGGKVVGDYIEFFAEMKIDPATSGQVRSPELYVSFNGSATVYASAGDPGSIPVDAPLSMANWSERSANDVWVMTTGKVQIPPGTTGYQIEVGLYSSGAGPCKFSIGRVAFD